MKKKSVVLFLSGGVGLLALSFGAFIFFIGGLPLFPEIPDVRVLAMPPMPINGDYHSPYQGMHPREMGRPDETFNFPIEIGEVGPVDTLFSGEPSYPFLCGENKVRPGVQPLVDNQDGFGISIFSVDQQGNKTEDIVGYSKDCLRETHASYYYNRQGTNRFYPLSTAKDDIATIEVNGREIDFVVRLETGTINRFMYAIAVLRGEDETLDKPQGDYWNERLVYQLRGGVGIGKRQGNFKGRDILKRRHEELQKGYAVIYSTANQTSNHYNIWLAEDTALRVKRQFIGLYGEPEYTVGIGGSGGALQQYLFAQNNPELLDAAIPLYSYPDMVSQTIYVMDCEPLEYYFDVVDGEDERWLDWSKRSWVEGMSGNNEAENRFQSYVNVASILSGHIPEEKTGSNECINGWRGLSPLIHNPNFVHFFRSFEPKVADNVHWTHWEDLKQFYGVDKHGYANSAWDNVGVQYGLQALQDDNLSLDDFLHLNANVGGWKPHHEMEKENFWLISGDWFPTSLSFWSHQNMYLREGGESPAKRSTASLGAIEGAHRSGQVFVGYADIPIVDIRHYLDDELDMHHATASFATRLRLQKGQGFSENQLIWMTSKPHTPTVEAFELIDRWMANIKMSPNKSVVQNRPLDARDRCFDAQGKIAGEGGGVWDGSWNGRPNGVCSELYPRYKTSREVAGESVAGDVFKCQLQSVNSAVEGGVYGNLDVGSYKDRLKQVFPDGVCDYSLPSMGRPQDGLFTGVQLASTTVSPNSQEALGQPTEGKSIADKAMVSKTVTHKAMADKAESAPAASPVLLTKLEAASR